MKFLVTGAAGFIGFHLSRRLLDLGHTVVGLDNLNDYYSVALKKDRLKILRDYDQFTFVKLDLVDKDALTTLFATNHFTHVINMAAQAGVRYSLENPSAYIQSNVVGFANLLEVCQQNKIAHLVYASSSSVYGLNTNMPFSVSSNVDHPISLYAASKKSNELMAHTYSYLYGLPCTGLRFFTVYGPWGRPDMALFLFTKAILEDQPIQVFNHGRMKRDFTYIDDIVEGVVRTSLRIPEADPAWDADAPSPGSSICPYRLYNIGNNTCIELMVYIEAIEKALGKTARKIMLPLQPGDVPATYAYVDDLMHDVGFKPSTQVEEGVEAFVRWYKDYYNA